MRAGDLTVNRRELCNHQVAKNNNGKKKHTKKRNGETSLFSQAQRRSAPVERSNGEKIVASRGRGEGECELDKCTRWDDKKGPSKKMRRVETQRAISRVYLGKIPEKGKIIEKSR